MRLCGTNVEQLMFPIIVDLVWQGLPKLGTMSTPDRLDSEEHVPRYYGL